MLSEKIYFDWYMPIEFQDFDWYMPIESRDFDWCMPIEIYPAVLSAQAPRSFEVWDGTRPPTASVGGLR